MGNYIKKCKFLNNWKLALLDQIIMVSIFFFSVVGSQLAAHNIRVFVFIKSLFFCVTLSFLIMNVFVSCTHLLCLPLPL
jgi:hypothetical protein